MSICYRCSRRDRLQDHGLRDEAVYFFLDDGYEMFTVGGLEGFCGFDLLCIADVVFRVE